MVVGICATIPAKIIKEMPFPKDYYWRFGANYWKLMQNQRELNFAKVLSAVLIYLVLASLFESVLQPFIIVGVIPLPFLNVALPFPLSLLQLSSPSFPISVIFLPFGTLPLGAFGAFLTLKLAKQSLNVGALMGIILLGGVVVNNAIILVDEINRLRRDGMRAKRAAVTAALSRIRPIAMTSFTTILGLLPLALSRTEESGLWAPMALVVIGGMTLTTFLTPILVPSLCLLLEDGRTLISSLIRFRNNSSVPNTVS